MAFPLFKKSEIMLCVPELIHQQNSYHKNHKLYFHLSLKMCCLFFVGEVKRFLNLY